MELMIIIESSSVEKLLLSLALFRRQLYVTTDSVRIFEVGAFSLTIRVFFGSAIFLNSNSVSAGRSCGLLSPPGGLDTLLVDI
jgi:hypothetical protein